jgi:hypothetical protein
MEHFKFTCIHKFQICQFRNIVCLTVYTQAEIRSTRDFLSVRHSVLTPHLHFFLPTNRVTMTWSQSRSLPTQDLKIIQYQKFPIWLIQYSLENLALVIRHSALSNINVQCAIYNSMLCARAYFSIPLPFALCLSTGLILYLWMKFIPSNLISVLCCASCTVGAATKPYFCTLLC